MKQRAIVLVKDGQEFIHKITAEKMILGRDKSCDIVLDDVSVSRRHAAIISRFEKVYVENISPSGQVLKGDTPFEYAEIAEDIDVAIGPYMLQWRFVDDSAFATSTPKSDPSDGVTDDASAESYANEQLADAPLNPDAQPGDNALQPYTPDDGMAMGIDISAPSSPETAYR